MTAEAFCIYGVGAILFAVAAILLVAAYKMANDL